MSDILTDLTNRQKKIVIDSLESMAGFFVASKINGAPISNDNWIKMFNETLDDLKTLYFKGDSRFNDLVKEYVDALKNGAVPSLYLLDDKTLENLGVLTEVKGLLSSKASKNMISTLGKYKKNIEINNAELGLNDHSIHKPISKLAKFRERLSSVIWGKFDPNSPNTSAIDRINVLDRNKYINDEKYREEYLNILKETRAAQKRGELISNEQLRLIREINRLEKYRQTVDDLSDPTFRMTAGGVAVHEMSKLLFNVGKSLFSAILKPNIKDNEIINDKRKQNKTKFELDDSDNEKENNGLTYIMSNDEDKAKTEEADEIADERFEQQQKQSQIQIEKLTSIDEKLGELVKNNDDKDSESNSEKGFWAMLGASFSLFFKNIFRKISLKIGNMFKMIGKFLAPMVKVLDFAKLLGRFLPLIMRFLGPLGWAITGITTAIEVFNWLDDKQKESAYKSQGGEEKYEQKRKEKEQLEADKNANSSLERIMKDEKYPEEVKQRLLNDARRRGYEYNYKTGKMEKIENLEIPQNDTNYEIKPLEELGLTTSEENNLSNIEEITNEVKEVETLRTAKSSANALAPIINSIQTSNTPILNNNSLVSTKDNPRNRDNSLSLYLTSRVVKFS